MSTQDMQLKIKDLETRLQDLMVRMEKKDQYIRELLKSIDNGGKELVLVVPVAWVRKQDLELLKVHGRWSVVLYKEPQTNGEEAPLYSTGVSFPMRVEPINQCAECKQMAPVTPEMCRKCGEDAAQFTELVNKMVEAPKATER